ncbi:conserved hypothetical protein [Trichodesmium erythraeum IMS101]|uniref:Type I restriction enzyme R protein N-terminal domain-containing protein n=1 Tax=Trichodesmium erythraeum (strain IMS101) TaxID=203124 RepID=Q10WD4_TRIEI|nr:hypothetical protein [Trichodesmium erythraeum GBRTRLIN201]
MSQHSILQENKSYTFGSYVELPDETEDILAEFNYNFKRAKFSLPTSHRQLKGLPELGGRIEESLPLVSLSSEAARPEVLIAPVLLQVARYCQCCLRIEYPLNINERLKSNLDYLLQANSQLLVIEAKNDDMTGGFRQLAVELIALSEWERERDLIFGCVTMGELWIFGFLDKKQCLIQQNIDSLRVPGDLEVLVDVLVGILEG